jgi:hypothetical protein
MLIELKPATLKPAAVKSLTLVQLATRGSYEDSGIFRFQEVALEHANGCDGSFGIGRDRRFNPVACWCVDTLR